jgi:hypothetical protein
VSVFNLVTRVTGKSENFSKQFFDLHARLVYHFHVGCVARVLPSHRATTVSYTMNHTPAEG